MNPVAAEQLGLAAMLAAAIVGFGACYAGLFALGRLRDSKRLLAAGYVSYALLAASTLSFATVVQLSGWWSALTVCLLTGYLTAPPFIWRLCVHTHAANAGRNSP